MVPRCHSCKFFYIESQGQGQCRREPPKVIAVPSPGIDPRSAQLNMVSYWPRIEQNEWCGEFVHDPLRASIA